MRVAILEWICGGGMHAIAVDQIPTSLANEGRAMLVCLLKLFSQASVDVVSMIDSRLAGDPSIIQQQFQLSDCDLVEFNPRAVAVNLSSPELDSVSLTIQAWIELASTCDLALVVAPEIDGVLQRCIREMKAAGIALLNCSGKFLDNASSKKHTAMVFGQCGIEHPKTLSLAEFLTVTHNVDHNQQWCVKSDLGAGCDGLQVGDASSIRKIVAELLTQTVKAGSSDWPSYIVQPWIEGTALSCSAIVDRQGRPHWFPLVTQTLESVPTVHGCSTRVYQGGRLVTDAAELSRPTALLNEVIDEMSGGLPSGAFGWVGVDLLLDQAGKWIVIEVNPRMTTSVIGLSKASPVNLAELMLAAFEGKPLPNMLDVAWKSKIRFNACGQADTI